MSINKLDIAKISAGSATGNVRSCFKVTYVFSLFYLVSEQQLSLGIKYFISELQLNIRAKIFHVLSTLFFQMKVSL